MASLQGRGRSDRTSSTFPALVCGYDTQRSPWQGCIPTTQTRRTRTITSSTKTWTAETESTFLECLMATERMEQAVRSLYRTTLSTASWRAIIETRITRKRFGRSVGRERHDRSSPWQTQKHSCHHSHLGILPHPDRPISKSTTCCASTPVSTTA